jgi:hypothetical protein
MTALVERFKNIPFGRILLFLFLFSMTLSLRKVFFVFSPDGSGSFNEYTDISLYASDVSFLLLLLYILLRNKKYILSILCSKRMFHVEQWELAFSLPLPFLVWATLSSFWAKSYELALYTSLRLWEGYFLVLIAWSLFVPRGTITSFSEKCSTWNIWKFLFRSLIGLGLLQALIAIGQFLKQGSLGLTFLKESTFRVTDTGIAKVIIFDQVFIRPYGLFLHPNVLAGFLGITLLFTLAYPLVFHRKMFHVEQYGIQKVRFWKNVPRGTVFWIWKVIKEKCSTWNKFSIFFRMFHVEHSRMIYRTILAIQFLSFLLTFSKSAFLSLGIVALYIGNGVFHVEQISSSFQNVPRGTKRSFWKWCKEKCSTWNKFPLLSKMFHVEQKKNILLSIIALLSFFFLMRSLNWQFFLWQPLQERIFLQSALIPEIREDLLLGVGAGQSVLVMQDFFSEKLLSWQFQPIHNGYLILLEELGLIGCIIFLWGILCCIKMFHVEQISSSFQNVPRGTKSIVLLIRFLKGGLLYLLLISLFDHYVWDIEAPRLLFWFLLGLLVATTDFYKLLTKYK